MRTLKGSFWSSLNEAYNNQTVRDLTVILMKFGENVLIIYRNSDPSVIPEVKVDLPWKNIKKVHPKMQLVTKTSRRDSTCYIFSLKFFRLLCFGFCFILILGSSVMSKLVLSLMSYQHTPNRTMELCVKSEFLFSIVWVEIQQYSVFFFNSCRSEQIVYRDNFAV